MSAEQVSGAAFPRTIDLHMHTNLSDGTDTPEEFLARIKKAGVGLFSITDHDSVKSCAFMSALLTADDPVFLSGVEFSCRDEEGKYHILGYGFDPNGESVRQVVEQGHGYRMKKLQTRLEELETRFGIQFTQEEIRDLFELNSPGKPHIANLMIKHGYARNKEEAITEYLDPIRFPEEHVRPGEAIEGILAGGGIPILAHPSFGDGDQRITGKDMDQRIRRLMGFGLLGLEAYYSGFSEELRAEILSLAERYGLYVTAGSDYHGKNKKVMPGDTGLGDPESWPYGLKRFLTDVIGKHAYLGNI